MIEKIYFLREIKNKFSFYIEHNNVDKLNMELKKDKIITRYCHGIWVYIYKCTFTYEIRNQ
jgi:hypothetical protein